MKLLGLDVGTKRTGVALATDGIVTEYETVAGLAETPEAVRVISEKEQIEEIVIGLPLNEDGTISQQAALVQETGKQIELLCKLPVVYTDEYLTSHEAERQMRQQGVGQADIDSRIDQYSAKLILEQFIADNTL